MRTKNSENLRPGYDSLAEAIVIQAGKDYLEYKKELWSRGYDRKIEYELEKVVNFFNSKWYRVLTDVDGEKIMMRLDENFENWKADELAKLIK